MKLPQFKNWTRYISKEGTARDVIFDLFMEYADKEQLINGYKLDTARMGEYYDKDYFEEYCHDFYIDQFAGEWNYLAEHGYDEEHIQKSLSSKVLDMICTETFWKKFNTLSDDDIVTLRNGKKYVVCTGRLVDPYTEDWIGIELYDGYSCIQDKNYDIIEHKVFKYVTESYVNQM